VGHKEVVKLNEITGRIFKAKSILKMSKTVLEGLFWNDETCAMCMKANLKESKINSNSSFD